MIQGSTVTRLALIALVIATATVGVRVADPLADGAADASPQLDPTAPPEEIAYAAMVATERRDVTVTAYRGRTETTDADETPRASLVRTVAYDNTDRQARGVDHWRDPDRLFFTNPYYTWTKLADAPGETASRVGVGQKRVRDQFYREDRIRRCGCVAVESTNASMLVLSVTDPETAFALRRGFEPGVENASLTLYVDVEQRVLRRAVFRAVTRTNSSAGDGGGQYRVVRGVDVYTDWGRTGVERPAWTGYSAGESIGDVLNLERGSWIGSERWTH